MENLISFKGIVYGSTNQQSPSKIYAFQDGASKLSYALGVAGEHVNRFLEYNGDLYALVSKVGVASGKILKLDSINVGVADSWSEVVGTSAFSEYICDMVQAFDRVYLIGTANILEWVPGVSAPASIDSMPADFLPYCALSCDQYVFLYGKYTTNKESVFRYDGADFVEVKRSDNYIDFEGSYDAFGKDLMTEYRGKVYFPMMYTAAGLDLYSYDVSNGVVTEEMSLSTDASDIPTCLRAYEGMILTAVHDVSANASNVLMFVPVKFEIEGPLVPGDGDTADLLKRVESDPISTEIGYHGGDIPAFDTVPVVGCLKGDHNNAFKYANRLELYTDLNDAEKLVELNLKDLMDQLCTLSNNVLMVNGENTAIVKSRDVVGRDDRFMQINHTNDYGTDYILSIEEGGADDSFENNFRSITINWDNVNWDKNNPVTIGFRDSDTNTFSYDSVLVNDPVTAKNIAINLLRQLVPADRLNTLLSFSHFLETTDNLSFNINENLVYLDKDKEYKIYQINHNIADKTTELVLLERLVNYKKEQI